MWGRGDKVFEGGVGKSCRIFGKPKRMKKKKLSSVGRMVANYLWFAMSVHSKHMLTEHAISKKFNKK